MTGTLRPPMLLLAAEVPTVRIISTHLGLPVANGAIATVTVRAIPGPTTPP